MRFFVVLMTLILGAAVIVTFVNPEFTLAGAGANWFPTEVGRGAEIVDELYHTTNLVAVVLLVLTFAALSWAVWRGAGRRAGEGSDRHGSGGLEVLWTVLPAAIVLYLTYIQIGAREAIAVATADENPLVIDVEGAQFDWRFRYAGADGALDTLDDFTEVVEMAVPIGRNVELRMHSADVIHSFYVPDLRLKRDLVPGTVTPLRFQIDSEDYAAAGSPLTIELRCAELCGWGHYAMVGRLRPMEPAAYEAWASERASERFSSGLQDGPEGLEFDDTENGPENGPPNDEDED